LVVYIIYINDAPSSKYQIMKYICWLNTGCPRWVTAVKVSNFTGHYLRNRSTLDIGVLGYIGIVWPKEHSPEVWHIPPGTPCI